MKNLYMFNALTAGLKIPFDLSKFTTAEPINATHTQGGTLLYGVGIPGGIRVKNDINEVNDVVGKWFETTSVGGKA